MFPPYPAGTPTENSQSRKLQTFRQVKRKEFFAFLLLMPIPDFQDSALEDGRLKTGDK